MRGSRRSGARRTSGDTTNSALVILGAAGDLATSRIIPAVQALKDGGHLPPRFLTLGVDRRAPVGRALPPDYHFIRGDLESQTTYSAVSRTLYSMSAGRELSAMFYLATGPELFTEIVRRLKREGLNLPKDGRRKVLVEKPFGVDLKSAVDLEHALQPAFARRDIFRVDHFLSKEGTDGILRARSENPELARLWNAENIEQVQIMADENFGVGVRGRFYDSVGVVRDMVQNHLLQIICLVAMEPPTSFDAVGLARAKAQVLRAVRVPRAQEVVWGQYSWYEHTAGVGSGTRTPTFVALKLAIDTPRWRGVPFYLRTGKALARTLTEVVVVFRPSPEWRGRAEGRTCVRFCIDPVARTVVEGGRGVVRGRISPLRTGTSQLNSGIDEYGRLLLDAINGDQTHFVDPGFNPLAWRLFGPMLRDWERSSLQRPVTYGKGSWGPSASDALLSNDRSYWRDGRSRD